VRKFLAWLLVTMTLVGAIASCSPSTSQSGDIIIASKDFTEQDILGQLLAQVVAAKTNLKVDLRPRLGGSFICHQAITNGKIDAYIEYTGTAYTGILKQSAIADPEQLYLHLRQDYAQKFDLAVLPSLGFENTFAMIIRGQTAQQYKIKTLSEVTQYTPQWRGGFGYEFAERADGYSGLAKAYGLKFAGSPQIMDLGLIYRAILQKQVDLIAGNSTDGQIARLGLVILQDDKHYFPAYQAVPIVRAATLKKYPQLQAAIEQLAGKISAPEMQRMNDRVESELADPKLVAQEFLRSKGLL
jgi:osmoprotectant transport system substrate-binding protein